MATIAPDTIRKARPWVGGIVGLLLAVLAVGIITVAIQTLGVLEEVRKGQEISLITQDEILSCTNPDGECYRRQQDQSGKAITSITNVSIAAAACANRRPSQTLDQIERCVRKELRAREQETP